MRNSMQALAPHETPETLQAAIEGLTSTQWTVREELVRVGFSRVEATKLVKIELTPNEENQSRLQAAMRNLGWADEQVELETQKFLDTINDTIDRVYFHQHGLFFKKEKP